LQILAGLRPVFELHAAGTFEIELGEHVRLMPVDEFHLWYAGDRSPIRRDSPDANIL
jgi:hypothetical protein